MGKIYLRVLLVFSLILISIADAQSPQELLNQYISDLQKNPNDNALREKIIKHVQTMSPAPAIPEEAERYMARGTAAAKGAKNPNDFKDAVREFEKASLVAPWLANAYYNLGVAQDGAGMYTEAIKSLKLYLLAVPNAADAKKLIYEIEYRKDKVAEKASATKEMFAAIRMCQVDDVRTAIDKGADVNSGEESQVFKATPLVATVCSCNANFFGSHNMEAGDEIVRLLIEKGADINAKMELDADNTALIEAVRFHEQKVNVLLSMGANVNKQNKYGDTALMWAVSRGLAGTVRLLIEKGAEINVKNNSGETALTIAKRHGFSEIIQMLKRTGATE